MTTWSLYGSPQIERYRAEDFSRRVIYRRLVIHHGQIYLLH